MEGSIPVLEYNITDNRSVGRMGNTEAAVYELRSVGSAQRFFYSSGEEEAASRGT